MKSPLASKSVTKNILEQHGLNAKHALGQNFLVDDNIIENIIKLAGLEGGARAENEDVCEEKAQANSSCSCAPSASQAGTNAPHVRLDALQAGADALGAGAGTLQKIQKASNQQQNSTTALLEIGPGLGTLTCALLEYAKVICIERDSELLAALYENTAKNSERLFVIQKDALKIDLSDIEYAANELQATKPSHLIANLPYQIAATLILDYFERFEFLEEMTVMVQKEVADRIAASFGSKDYGAYSIKLSFYAKTYGRFSVPANCFYPKPHVESAVIHLERIDCGYDEKTRKLAVQLANAAFAHRRKTIKNSMKSAYDTDTVDALLASCNIEPRVRAEMLEPEVFLQMAYRNRDIITYNEKR